MWYFGGGGGEGARFVRRKGRGKGKDGQVHLDSSRRARSIHPAGNSISCWRIPGDRRAGRRDRGGRIWRRFLGLYRPVVFGMAIVNLLLLMWI